MGLIYGLYWGYSGIMEKKMETTILGLYRVGVEGLGFRARVERLGFGG